MRPHPLAAALLAAGAAALALAGCADPAGSDAPFPGPVRNAAGQAVVAHTGEGLQPVPAGWLALEVVAAPSGLDTAEPTVGVLADGAAVAPAYDPMARLPTGHTRQVLRPWITTDGGGNWTALASGLAADEHASLDPWVWVDQATDRIFHVGTNLACVYVSWSDDRGRTWTDNPVACGAAVSTYSDHESLVTGPPPAGEAMPTSFPSLVYVARNGGPAVTVQSIPGTDLDSPVFGSYAAVSRDGGATFEAGLRAHRQDECQFGLQGPIHVGPDGTAYYPKATCRGLDVAVSRDGGRSWELAGHIEERGASHAVQNPHVATDASGHAYAAYQASDGQLWASRSTDAGATWGPPVRVSPPGLTSTLFSSAVAGREGSVAFLYHATRADTSEWEHPEAPWASDDAAWHTYMTFTADGLAADPLFVTVQVSEEPVLRGCTTAIADPCPRRPMYDFTGLAERDGIVYGAIMDSCDACTDAQGSSAAQLVLLRTRGGPALR